MYTLRHFLVCSPCWRGAGGKSRSNRRNRSLFENLAFLCSHVTVFPKKPEEDKRSHSDERQVSAVYYTTISHVSEQQFT